MMIIKIMIKNEELAIKISQQLTRWDYFVWYDKHHKSTYDSPRPIVPLCMMRV